jgi:hypothetical protein
MGTLQTPKGTVKFGWCTMHWNRELIGYFSCHVRSTRSSVCLICCDKTTTTTAIRATDKRGDVVQIDRYDYIGAYYVHRLHCSWPHFNGPIRPSPAKGPPSTTTESIARNRPPADNNVISRRRTQNHNQKVHNNSQIDAKDATAPRPSCYPVPQTPLAHP